jgi:hypothetical protein
VLLYLLIAVGGVTHRDLLYASPIKLPFLSIDLPLVGFFVLGPLLFLIVHAYVLLHLVLLANKVGTFHNELEAQIVDDATRGRLRRQLPSNVFVQFLAGPREVRTGIIGLMLRLIAQISLIVGPLMLLVFFQLRFLAYHDDWVTWWHRIAVVLDLALLWVLWPAIARGETRWLAWRDLGTRKGAGAVLASLMLLSFVVTIATFPGEWFAGKPPSVRFIPTQWPLQPSTRQAGRLVGAQNDAPASFWARLRAMRWTSLHEILLVGDVDQVTRKPTSLWSNRLVVPGLDVQDGSKTGGATVSLRGRRLENAVLSGARLGKVDLTGA